MSRRKEGWERQTRTERERQTRRERERKGSFVPRDYNAVTVKMLK